MSKKYRGPVAILRTWVTPPEAHSRFVLHLTSDVEVRGNKARFTHAYPDGATVIFAGGRVEAVCEVLPSHVGEQAVRQGRLPGGNLPGLQVLRYAGGRRRVALRVQRIAEPQTLVMPSRLLVIPQRKLGDELSSALLYIGIDKQDLQNVIDSMRDRIRGV